MYEGKKVLITTRELVCNKVKSPDMNVSRLFQMASVKGAPSNA